MTGSEKNNKKRKQFEVDPSIYQPGPPDPKHQRYLVEPAKTLAKFAFVGLLFAYPLALVSAGVIFGGLVFWGLFTASMAGIGLVLWKGGYAKHYEAWDISMRRQVVGIVGGGFVAIAFFLGLFFLQLWMALVFPLILAVGIVIMIKTSRF